MRAKPKPRREPSTDLQRAIAARLPEGRPYKTLAHELGASVGHISDIAAKVRRQRYGRRRHIERKIVAAYADGSEPVQTIAARFGVSPQYVQYLRQRAGVPTRRSRRGQWRDLTGSSTAST